jgi:hypothetical protein
MILERLVIGNSFAAVLAIASRVADLKSHSEEPARQIAWLPNTRSHLVPPFAGVHQEVSIQLIEGLARAFEIDLGAMHVGQFVREWRSKGFVDPDWSDVRESLWDLELPLAQEQSARWDMSLAEFDARLRSALATSTHVQILDHQMELASVHAVTPTEENGMSQLELKLGSGEVLFAQEAIFADRWSKLATIGGIPKVVSFMRKKKPVSVFQAYIEHSLPVSSDIRESFFIALHKEAGEDHSRHVWGHFFDQGRKSVWSVAIDPEEGEDNHEITKRYRRMKQALDRLLTSTAWMGESKTFSDSITKEQLRFEDGILLSSPLADSNAGLDLPQTIDALPGLTCVTEAFGIDLCLSQIARLSERTAEPSLFAQLTSDIRSGLEPTATASST